MSYDLYFYKEKDGHLTEIDIANYLTKNLVKVDKEATQWFFQNPDTGVYYSFDQNEAEDDTDSIELYESFADFTNTHFSFNLNFMRPAFFGLEAFRFIEKFINDLNLFILNPQGDIEIPCKITKEELFENWNQTNLRASADHFEELGCSYIPMEKSNAAWKYNFNRGNLQAELGDSYFVPKIFFFKTRKDNSVLTLATWTEHIPSVIPPADYFILWRQYRKLFKRVKDNILISRETLINNFGEYFNDYKFTDCKIIHPENSIKVKDKFNSVKPDKVLKEFAEGVDMENLYNAK